MNTMTITAAIGSVRGVARFFAFAVAFMMGGGACDSLKNPEHFPVRASYTQDGNLTILFWDALATLDAELNIVRWTDYPRMPPPSPRDVGHRLSKDGTHVLLAWSDEGATNNSENDITIPPGERPTALVFSAADATIFRTFELPFVRTRDLALSDDGAILFANLKTGETETTAAYRVSDGAELWTRPGRLSWLSPSPGQGTIVGIDQPNSVQVGPPFTFVALDAATGATRMEVVLPLLEYVQSVGVAGDGSVAVVSGGSRDPETDIGRYLIIRLSDGTIIDEIWGPNEVAAGVDPAVSSGGRALASGASRRANTSSPNRIMDFFIWADGSLRLQEATWGYPALTFSPDGTKLLSLGDKGVVVYSIPDGAVIQRRSYTEQIF